MKEVMRFLVMTAALSSSAMSMGSTDMSYFDEAFIPLELETLIDEPTSSEQTTLTTTRMIVGTLYPLFYGFHYIENRQDFHKKMISSKSLISKAKVLEKVDIDKIMSNIEGSGIRGNTRLVFVVEEVSNIMHGSKVGSKLTSKNAGSFITARSDSLEISNKAVYAKEITKEELERALVQMSNDNIKMKSVELKEMGNSKWRIAGSVFAVYITLDLIHSLRN